MNTFLLSINNIGIVVTSVWRGITSRIMLQQNDKNLLNSKKSQLDELSEIKLHQNSYKEIKRQICIKKYATLCFNKFNMKKDVYIHNFKFCTLISITMKLIVIKSVFFNKQIKMYTNATRS